MSDPDLALPDPAHCIHQRLVLDLTHLLRGRIAVVACNGTVQPLASVAKALKFPAFYGRNWDAMDECLRGLNEWWPANGWVVEVADARGAVWRKLDDCWRHAAEVHAAAGRSLHLNYL